MRRLIGRSPAAGVLIVAALVFLAGLFLDTAGVIELSWLCLRGQCGLPARYVLPGVALLLAGAALLLRPVAAAAPLKGGRKPAGKARATSPAAKSVGKTAVAKPKIVKSAASKPSVAKPGAVRPPGRTPTSRIPSSRRPATGQRPR